METIRIKGLEIFAYHGVNPEEKENGQRFVLDLAMTADLSRAAQSDDLRDTVNYAAVRKAGLEVVERYPHSLSVSYIPKGMDATVDWGNKDFKFKNNRSEPIYIACYVDGFEQVHVSLYGSL